MKSYLVDKKTTINNKKEKKEKEKIVPYRIIELIGDKKNTLYYNIYICNDRLYLYVQVHAFAFGFLQLCLLKPFILFT